MTTGYQIKDQSAAHFLTIQVVYWIDLFTRKDYRDIIIDSLKFCQQEKGLEIFAWVIMSNHVHILARSATGELSNTIRDFKKFTSKKIIEHIIESSIESRKDWMLRLFQFAAKRHNKSGKYQVWSHENHAEEVFSNSFIESKVIYIHENPVKAGIVSNPEDYIYSSAPAYAGKDRLLEIIPITFSVKVIR
ncbi:MAG: transposase [Lentimicrobium sp.]|nr:transposase [Lentimicrobium sp.]